MKKIFASLLVASFALAGAAQAGSMHETDLYNSGVEASHGAPDVVIMHETSLYRPGVSASPGGPGIDFDHEADVPLD